MGSVRKRGAPSINTTGGGNGRVRFTTHETSLETRIGKNVTPLPSGCWQWGDGSVDYPATTAYGEPVRVHRWIYFALHPELDPSEWERHHAHHHCQNPRCVNPAHIQLLTPKEHKQRHREIKAAS